MTTYQKLINQITEDFDREYRAVQSHGALYRALQRFEGKILGKRLIAAYKEVAPFRVERVAFEFTAGLHYLDVFLSSGERIRHFIGYARDWACCDPSTLAERDGCNGEAAIRRNDERQQLLNNLNYLRVLAKAIDQHNVAFRHVEALTDHGMPGREARYIAARMLEGTEDFRRAQDEARAARRNV